MPFLVALTQIVNFFFKIPVDWAFDIVNLGRAIFDSVYIDLWNLERNEWWNDVVIPENIA